MADHNALPAHFPTQQLWDLEQVSDVRFWLETDIPHSEIDVRFALESGRRLRTIFDTGRASEFYWIVGTESVTVLRYFGPKVDPHGTAREF